MGCCAGRSAQGPHSPSLSCLRYTRRGEGKGTPRQPSLVHSPQLSITYTLKNTTRSSSRIFSPTRWTAREDPKALGSRAHQPQSRAGHCLHGTRLLCQKTQRGACSALSCLPTPGPSQKNLGDRAPEVTQDAGGEGSRRAGATDAPRCPTDYRGELAPAPAPLNLQKNSRAPGFANALKAP